MLPPMRRPVPGMTTGAIGSQGSFARSSGVRSRARRSPPNGISAQLRWPGSGGSEKVRATSARLRISCSFLRQITGGGVGCDCSQSVATVSSALSSAVSIARDSSRGKTAGRLKAGNGSLQCGMHEIAKCQGVEQKRVFGLAGLVPAETVLPEIAEWIAQQFDERGRRLLALKGPHHDGMITANEPVMRGQPLGMPVDPAGQ